MRLMEPTVLGASFISKRGSCLNFHWKMTQTGGVSNYIVQLKGVICFLLLTKVTVDTPSSYCTIAPNIRLSVPKLYFWFLPHLILQQKEQWVRMCQVHSLRHIVLQSRFDIFTRQFIVTASTVFQSYGLKIEGPTVSPSQGLLYCQDKF